VLTSAAARRLPAALALLTLLGSALLGSVLLAAPALAAERVIAITAGGLVPGQLTIAPGDTVVLVNQDAPLRYRARSTSTNWTFDSGLVPLGQGERYGLPQVTRTGTYDFTVLDGEAAFSASVVLPAPRSSGPAPAPAPAGSSPQPQPQPQPSPAAPSRPGVSPAPATSPAPSPAAAGGSGTAALPPLVGGFGAGGGVPLPALGGSAQPPALADPRPALPAASAGPSPETAVAPPTDAPAGSLAVAGDLPGAGSSRGFGLPAVLAVVLAAGVASLLVRLLLAEPAARRRSAEPA
jgi:plastocyanin